MVTTRAIAPQAAGSKSKALFHSVLEAFPGKAACKNAVGFASKTDRSLGHGLQRMRTSARPELEALPTDKGLLRTA